MIQIVAILLSGLFGVFSFAHAESSSSSYIDQVKERMDSDQKEKRIEGSYTQKLKKQLGASPSSSYIDQLKASESYQERMLSQSRPHSDSGAESYTEMEKKKLAPESQGGAIQATLEGRSELKEKRKGQVRHAFGLKYGFNLRRDFKLATSSLGGPSFQSLYESNYGPQFGFYFERQSFHSEIWGSLGLVGLVDFGYFHGRGQLSQPIQQPGTTQAFALTSSTQFQFFMLPVTLGVNYRFNLLHYIRPFVFVGPTAVGYLETRSDEKSNHYGVSTSWLGSVGVSFLLNPFDRKSAWDLYLTQGVHLFYLTLEYTKLMAIGGNVRFSYSGVFAGLTYEY